MWSPIPKNISTSPDAGPVKVDMMVGPKQFERITGFLNCSNVYLPTNYNCREIKIKY